MTPITMNPQDPIGDRPTMEPQQPTRRGRRRVLLIGILVLVLVVLAGGYVAATRGYIALPFITPSKDELFAKMIASLSSIENAQYTLRTDIGVEDRQGGAETLFPNTNASDDTGYSGDAFLDTVNGITGSNDIFRSIPLDMGVQTAVTFYFEADAEPREADARLAIDGTYHGGDLDAAFDLEARKRGEDFYAIVRKFPSLPVFDVSPIKGKWIAATPDDPVGSALLDGLENVKIREQVDRLKDMLGDALEQEVFTVERRLPAETIAGVNTLQYRIALHPENLAAVYRARIEEKTAKGESAYSLETALKSLEKPETIERLNRLARQSTVTVWIERATGLLRQIRWHLAVVPPDSSERMAGKQFAVTTTLTLEHVNENISVDTPGETIDYDEAERLLTGIDLEEQQFRKQYSRISDLRDALDVYHDDRDAYPESLATFDDDLRQITDRCREEHERALADPGTSPSTRCLSATYFGSRRVSTTDVYTEKPYGYRTEGDNDYRITYEVRLPEDASGYYAEQVADGTNTATSTDISIEKETTYERPTTPPSVPLPPRIPSIPVVGTSDYVRGASNATVTLIEYCDIASTFCKDLHASLRQLLTELPDTVNWIHRYATAIANPVAQRKAEAVRCVGSLEGNERSWAYLDLLYEKTVSASIDTTTDQERLLAMYGELGGDAEKLRSCLDAHETTTYVETEAAAAKGSGVAGVPMTYIAQNPGQVIDSFQGRLTFPLVKAKVEATITTITGDADDDGDGLKNSNERLLGTDTAKNDTDGDSFDDKTEYFNGYNPNGSGASTTGAWSACANLSTLSGITTCAAYCTSVGKRCVDSGITTDDTYGYGAETWNSDKDCSAKSGLTKKNSCGAPSLATDARVKCFCR